MINSMGNPSKNVTRLWAGRALLLFLGWAFLAIPLQADRRRQDPIILIPGETVYVEVIQSTVTSSPGFSWTDSGERDRFYKLSLAIEEAFLSREVPLKIKVVRWGADIPKGATTATLTLIRWDRNGVGEIETRIAGQLKKNGSKINLGIFVGTESPMPVASSMMLENSYQSSAVKAASRFADRMNEQINF